MILNIFELKSYLFFFHKLFEELFYIFVFIYIYTHKYYKLDL